MKGLVSVALIGAFLIAPAAASAAENAIPIAQAAETGAVTGTILDTRQTPLGGATIDAVSGSTHVSATSADDGTFTLTLPPGIYDVTVSKGGFQQAEQANLVVVSATTTPLRVVLVEATVSNLRVIGSVSSSQVTASSSITPVSSLPAVTLQERQVPSLQEVLPELPGVTFGARGDTTDSYQYFTVRGAAIETQVQIDGHPISVGYGGRWDLSQVNPDVFGAIDVFKGPGIDGANAGESVFGTVNLRTRDFTPDNEVSAELGTDQYGAQFSSFNASGNLFDNRLGYVLSYNVDGVVGPEHGQTGWFVWPDANNPGYGVAEYSSPLDDDVNQHSELAKLDYHFSDATSFTAGFIGFQGTQNPQGIPYGYYAGQLTIEPSDLSGEGETTNTAPYAGHLVGQTIPGYVWYPGTFTTTSQPFFEGELRTTLGGDTLLLRPYTGVVTRIVDGNEESAYPDPQYNNGWQLQPDGSYLENFGSAYDEYEAERLHGVTFTYLHPFSDRSFLNFSYDYHSVFTEDFFGYPVLGVGGAAPTTARTSDISLSGVLPLARNVKLAVGDYETIWSLDYLFGLNADQPATRSVSHNDPHLGLNWRPSPAFGVRASAGSGITFPYASQVSGYQSVSNDNGLETLVTVNPNLNPEVTVAYDLGADLVLPGRSKLSLDLYDNTVHGAFIDSAYAVPPTTNLALSPLAYTVVSEWLNGSVERNFGVELALASDAHRDGIGFAANATLQRAYYDLLSPSFYAVAASTAINDQQISGIPFATAHGEISWQRSDADFRAAFGADYVGQGNWTNGPGFVTFYATLRHDAGSLGTLQLSASNLFNRGTGAPFGYSLGPGSGFAQPQLGPNPGGPGLVYSAIPQYLQGVVPLTVRVSLTKRIRW